MPFGNYMHKNINSNRDQVSPDIEIQKQEFNVATSTMSPKSDNDVIQTF